MAHSKSPGLTILVRTAIAASVSYFLLSAGTDIAAAQGKCTSMQARCAVKIGGRCDPATGRWEYGKNGAGGTTLAYNDCISKSMSGRK